MRVRIILERESPERWIADVPSMGLLLYGSTRRDAIDRAKQGTFSILSGRILHGEERAPNSVEFVTTSSSARKRNGLPRFSEVFAP
jgi:hypothetical protein